MRHILAGAAILCIFAVVTLPAQAVVIWDESADGDLSGNGLGPNSFNLGVGTSSLTATSQSGDREYVHFHLNPGTQLSQVVLVSYVSAEPSGLAFIGVQAGSTFTEPFSGANPANLLGYTHFGTGAGNVGANILPSIGTGFGSQGFTPPLTGSDYSFWMQQTSSTFLTTYQFDFVVTPEPAMGSLAILLAPLLRRRS